MSNDILLALCLLLNGSVAMLGFVIRYQTPPGPVRNAFLVCLASYSAWMTAVLLFRVDTVPNGAARLLSQAAFSAGMVSILSMGIFLLRLCNYRDPSRKRYSAVLIVAIAGIAAPFTGLVEAGVALENGTPRPIYGPLHPYFTAATGIVGLYFVFTAYRGYRTIQSEVMKFQMQRILIAAIVTFAGAQLTNAVLPVATGSSRFSVAGVFWPMGLFGAIIHLLVKGRSLLILRSIREILQSSVGRIEENQAALRQYIEVFRFAILDAPPAFDRRISAVNRRHENFRIRVERPVDGSSLTERQTAATPADVPGFFNRIADLEREQLRLAACLLRAEALLGAKVNVDGLLESSPALIEHALAAPISEDSDLTPLEQAEKNTILRYLERHSFNQAETSRILGIRPNTLINKMRKYQIATSRQRS